MTSNAVDGLTIQQVAKLTGLSEYTLRYYERNGLIAPVSRASNSHRRYSQQDLNWIELLNRLRTTGMPIRQMQQFATLVRQHPHAIAQRRELLEAHRAEVQKHIQELSGHLAAIDYKIELYQKMEFEQEQKFDASTVSDRDGNNP
jgi:DNA-binding transcriptional MerR regulator